MERADAIILLAGCIPLATKLNNQGFDFTLEQIDLTALAAFNKVRMSEFRNVLDVYEQSGLSRKDMENLEYMVSIIQAERMRQQYARGKQVDYWTGWE